MSEPVGVSIVGVGIMGAALARRLMKKGHSVTVFDIDSAKVAALVAEGAQSASTPADATIASNFVITSLNSASIVRSVVFEPTGIAENASPKKLLIDMSTIDPISTRIMAAELRTLKGMPWVDAPLSGGAPKAETGELTVMAGGSAEDMERARLVIDSLVGNFTHMGPIGAGQTTKMINQVLLAIGFQALAEAIRLAQAGGVDPAKLSAALAGGRADSQILQEYGPKMASGDLSPTGRIDNMLKDLEAVQVFAQKERIPLFLTSMITDLHRQFVLAGIGAEDTVAMMSQFKGYRK